jgi:pimeloyl-ACP methyl ester carboxylesterase
MLTFLPSCRESATQPSKTILQLKPCTVGSTQALCGKLNVFENHVTQNGRKIDINIVVFKAQSDTPAPDPVFYLAGGPGGAATEDAQRQQFPYSLSRNHDLVFVDQRGTGGSNRLMAPTNLAEYMVSLNTNPRYYNTSAAMDDLDEVRAALGYDQINLVGYSYGATAAQYYLRQHEAHVRSMTLGSGSLLDIPVFERWAYNSQRALNLIFELCLAEPACQKAFPDIKTEFAGLMARLAGEPVTQTFTNPGDQKPATVTFTADYFAGVIRAMMKDAKYDRSLPQIIHQVYKDNDWTGIMNFYISEGGPEWWGGLMMERVIRCHEKWAAFDPAEVAQLSQGSFLAGWDVSLAKTQAHECSHIPQGNTPEELAPQPGSQVPVLFLNGELDPIDPPDNLAGAKGLWPNSTALVGLYQGHAISDMAEISCWFSIMDEFIQSGSEKGLHTSCMQNVQPPVFLVP